MNCEIINSLFKLDDLLLIITLYVLQIHYPLIFINKNRLQFEIGLRLFLVKFLYVINTLIKLLIVLL